MTMPPGIATVTLTGRYIRPDGTPLKGTVTFATPALLTLSGADTISAGSATVTLDELGMFYIVLVATDNAAMEPSGWAYQVTERFADVTGRTYAITLPSTTPTADIADLAPADPSQGQYILVPGPPGPAGPRGATILTGTGAPSNAFGADGDTYVDLTASNVKIHGPKAGGVWPAGVALSGGLTQAAADVRYPLLTRTARSDRGIYVPAGWGEHWRAKRNAAATGKATIAVVGGSASQGMYASNPITKSWPGVVRTALQAAHGDGGSGFMSSSLSAPFLTSGDPAALAAWQAAGAIVGQTGSWSQGGNRYGPGTFYLFTETTGASLTFTVRGTTAKIHTVSGGTRPSFTYAIDGGSPVTVTQATGAAAIQVTTVTGLAPTSHTVTITCGTAGAGQYLSVCGVSGENATGIVVNNLAIGGAKSETYAGYLPSALNATWNGGVDFPADLVVYTAGPNDAASNVDVDVWSANVAKYLRAVRDTSGSTGAVDVMILLPHVGKHDVSNFKYQDFAARSRGMAEAYGAALVDMWALGRNSWGYWSSLGYWGTSATPGAVGADGVHPCDAGFQYMADVILPLLTS